MSQKEFESVKLSGWVYHKDKTLINVEDFIAEFTDWMKTKVFVFQVSVAVMKFLMMCLTKNLKNN